MDLKEKGKIFEYKGFTITRTKNSTDMRSLGNKHIFALEIRKDYNSAKEVYSDLRNVKMRIATLIDEQEEKAYKDKILKMVCERFDPTGASASELTLHRKIDMDFLRVSVLGLVDHVVKIETKIKELEERLPKKRGRKKKKGGE